MKGKALLSLAIVLAMVTAAIPFAAVKGQSDNSVTCSVVFPNGLSTISETPGSTFTVSINIAATGPTINISDYDMLIGWNESMLALTTNASSDIVEGPWLKFFGSTLWAGAKIYDNNETEVPDALLSGYATASTGTMFTIGFTAKAPGVKPAFIDILVSPGQPSYLLNGTLTGSVPINVIVDGLVTIPVPPPTAPEAIITKPTAFEQFSENSIVTLNGSASTPGYNTLPSPGEACPITIWNWTVAEPNGTVFRLTGNVASFNCSTFTGTYTIALLVLAPVPDSYPVAPGYVDSSTASVTIYVMPPLVGPKIVVYTARSAGCPPGWSDTYGPQEQICVFANVTYNGAPVWYKPVEFVVYLPSGAEIASFEAFTNETGTAKVCFRIPWEANESTQYFGIMSINGTVDVSQVQVYSSVKFYYGWKLEINAISITNDMSLHRSNALTHYVGTMSLSVTICSWEIKATLPAFIECTAVDNCGVPFGQFTNTFKVPPGVVVPPTGVPTNVTKATITIPEWAYVGTGTLYVDLLNCTSTGVPYCPENSAIFSIVYP
jgi:hypothetical protein